MRNERHSSWPWNGLASVLAGEPDHLVVNWHIGSPAIDHTRKQESLRPHPSPVAAQLFQKRRAERYIAVAPSLPGAP
jgi:hypothetical protein